MVTIKGKYNEATVFTDNFDNETVSQLTQLLNQPFTKGAKIRIMPDCHAGAGCVIGTTMTITDKVVPNLVGVDIGCLDGESEVLTPNGWIKISEYDNQQILVYDYFTDKAKFEQPLAYIKLSCDKFYHFHSKKGLDQMLSAEHKMLLWHGYKNRGYIKSIDMAKDVFEKHNSHTKSNLAIKTTFGIENEGLHISDNLLRIWVMLSADGHIKNEYDTYNYVTFHFVKQRKIDRCIELLKSENIWMSIDDRGTDTYVYCKLPKIISKDMTPFYLASNRQLEIIADEVFNWDGAIDEKRNHSSFSSTDKKNADVIQYVFHAQGVRAGMFEVCTDKKNWNKTYQVYKTQNEYVGFPNRPFEEIDVQNAYKYCFTTSTGFFIMRRNNNVSITGNCGMLITKLKEKEISFEALDEITHLHIPSGMSIYEKERTMPAKLHLEDIKAPVDISRAKKSLGTLGGGNHFIEVDKDDEGNLYLVIHTGSRHLGLEIAKYYQDLGYRKLYKADRSAEVKAIVDKLKAEGRQSEIESAIKSMKQKNPLVPKELCYVEGDDFKDYLHDVAIAQNFAALNRKDIAGTIINELGVTVADQFETVHNYIDIENMILRKGSVSAKDGERIIIPMNMRDGSLICIGKGNDDWNCSAPHGAGRLYSRSKAKEAISMDEFAESMKGIYTTCVCESTIDESPMAYKPMDEIVANIEDTADIEYIIKPVYNFKAH